MLVQFNILGKLGLDGARISTFIGPHSRDVQKMLYINWMLEFWKYLLVMKIIAVKHKHNLFLDQNLAFYTILSNKDQSHSVKLATFESSKSMKNKESWFWCQYVPTQREAAIADKISSCFCHNIKTRVVIKNVTGQWPDSYALSWQTIP